MSNNVIKFELDQKSLKVKELLNKDFLELKVKSISTAYPNRNGSAFTLESLEKAVPTFYNKPILGSFSVQQDDFRAHEGDLSYDSELDQMYYDYTDEVSETPLGLIRSTDKVEIAKDKKDGLYWLSFTCAIWVQYNYKQVKKLLKSKDGNKKISVEVSVNSSHVDENGIEVIDDFDFCGVTILGDKYETGIADASMTILDLVDNAIFQKKQQALTFAYDRLENAESLDFKDQGSNIQNENPEEEISMEENSKKGGENDPMTLTDKEKLEEDNTEVVEFEEAEKCSAPEEQPEEDPKCVEDVEHDPEDVDDEDDINDTNEDPDNVNDDDDEEPSAEKNGEDDISEEDDEEDLSCNKFAFDDSIIQSATDVMASYQNANKWLDIIKEMLFTDLGCVFFSSYVHELAHTMPGRFDKFGDILHTVNIKIPYPATEYIPNEATNVEEAFNSIFMILDSIKFNLNAFIKATDENYHGMACAAEALLNDIEGEYVPLYKMQKAYESCGDDLVKFDKWINQYVNNRDKLVESLNTYSCGEGCEGPECESKCEDPECNDPECEELKCEENPEDVKDCEAKCGEEEVVDKEEESCDAKFAEEGKPNSEPSDESRNVDDKTMGEIVTDATASIKAPPVVEAVIGEGSQIDSEVSEGPNGEKAEVVSRSDGIEGDTDVEQPDDEAKENVFSSKENVSTVELDGEQIDINTLLEKYNKLNERFEELSNNVKVREAQDLAKFGEEFINSDVEVDEESRKEFVEKVSSKCEKFELLTQEEVKDFAKSLLAMYYYENMVSRRNKDTNFSIDIQETAHKESQASNKLKDAINKLNHVN